MPPPQKKATWHHVASRDQKEPEKSRKNQSEPERSTFQPLEIGRTNKEPDKREQEREEENIPSPERKWKSRRRGEEEIEKGRHQFWRETRDKT